MNELRRLPLAPLLPFLARTFPPASETGHHSPLGCNLKEIYRRTAVCSTTLTRAGEAGLSWITADHLAIACGVHPALVWGDDWWDLPDARGSLYRTEPRRQRELTRVGS